MTAALFMIGAVAQPALSAGMADRAASGMQADMPGMAAPDDMPCPMSSDCSGDRAMKAMTCFAHCAGVVGIVVEPVDLPVIPAAHRLTAAAARPLASLHSPPEPHPPKPIS